MDWQSVKITEECGKPDPNAYDAHGNGYDVHKTVNSRKRHLLVDTLGLPLSIYVAPVDVEDRDGVRLLLAGSKPQVPRLRKIRADGAHGGEPLAEWCRGESGWELEIVERERKAGASRS